MAAGGAELERGRRWRRPTAPGKTSHRSKQGRRAMEEKDPAPCVLLHGMGSATRGGRLEHMELDSMAVGRAPSNGDCWRPQSRRGR
jgi:lipoprotein-anchoring transpeptidase ErfK/SrfK